MNLLPCLTRTSKRPEESVQETLAAAVPKIMASFGNFANDNEIKVRLSPQVTREEESYGEGALARQTCGYLLGGLCFSTEMKLFCVLWRHSKSPFPLGRSYCG